jgi:uncharacterized protein (DUF58 family)
MIGLAWWWLLVALYALSAIQREPRLLLLALLLSFASAASALWARYSLAGLQYRRSLGRDRLSFGEETELTIEIYNAKPLPLPWVLVSDQYPDDVTLLTGELGISRTASFRHALVNFLALRWYERVRRTYRIRGDHRGVYRFGPAEIYAGDVFGFRRQHMTAPHEDTLIVYPKVVPVAELGLPASHPLGDFPLRQRVTEDPLRYQSVRDYAPGDPFRHIHWKATARRAQLQTRLFDPSASHSLMLLLDVQTSERPYAMVPAHLELLISAAASLAADALERGYAVGLMANAGPVDRGELTRVPVGRRPDQLVVILEALAYLSAFRLTPFHRLLTVLGPNSPYGSTLVALTAKPEEPVQEALLWLEEQGYAVLLLTVGEQAPSITPEITSYHLGGAERWHELETLQPA